jgi:hypothetical protein
MSEVLGVFELLDFTKLRPVLVRQVFLNLRTVYLFNFSSFSGRVGDAVYSHFLADGCQI